MSRTPKKRAAKKPPKPDSLALAEQASGIAAVLPDDARDDIEDAMPPDVRAFYYALVDVGYSNATAALRRIVGDSTSKLGRDPGSATFRKRAHNLRRRADVEALVADDMRRMHMTSLEAKASLASVARHADMRLFIDETGAVDLDAVRLYGDAVKEYSETIKDSNDGKTTILHRTIKLHDRPKVLDTILRHMPQDEGGSQGADAPNIFTQINQQIITPPQT